MATHFTSTNASTHLRCKALLSIFFICWLINSPINAAGISDESADGLRAAILLSAVTVAGISGDTEGLYQFGKSLLATTASTLVLKEVVASERPSGEDDDSFPSGHVSVAIAGASFLHKRYGLKYGAPAYVASTLIAHNRVENDHHRIADVAASLLLAMTINNKLTSKLQVTPQYSTSEVSIHVQLLF